MSGLVKLGVHSGLLSMRAVCTLGVVTGDQSWRDPLGDARLTRTDLAEPRTWSSVHTNTPHCSTSTTHGCSTATALYGWVTTLSRASLTSWACYASTVRHKIHSDIDPNYRCDIAREEDHLRHKQCYQIAQIIQGEI